MNKLFSMCRKLNRRGSLNNRCRLNWWREGHKGAIQRIQSEYSGKANVTTGTGGEKAADSRLRTPKKYENKNKNISQENSTLENSNSKKQTIKGLRAKNDQQRDEKEMEQEFGWDGNEQTDYLEYDNFLGKEKKEKRRILPNKFSDIIFLIMRIWPLSPI